MTTKLAIAHRIGLALVAVATSALLATSAIAAEEPVAPSPVGKWKTIDDDTGKAKSVVHIFERNGKLYGKIVELLNLKPDEDPNPVCTECEGPRKDKPIIGMTILWGLEQDDDEWEGGRILDPENGKTYRAKIWLEGEDKLKVRGYLAIFHRTQTWHRVK